MSNLFFILCMQYALQMQKSQLLLYRLLEDMSSHCFAPGNKYDVCMDSSENQAQLVAFY